MTNPVWTLHDTELNFYLILPRSKALSHLMTLDQGDLNQVQFSFTPGGTEAVKAKDRIDYIDTVFWRGVAPGGTQNHTTSDLVQQIRTRFPIAPFVAPYTHGLKQSKQNGPWFVGRCPFHQPADDPPTKLKFWVNTTRQVCGCFVPRCVAHQPPMDVINFYAAVKQITNYEAIKLLGERL